jgi:hypothetical protein
MEWATGITVRNGEMMAKIRMAGAQELVEVGKLARRGLPNERTFTRSFGDIRLRDMVRVAADEYLEAFGIAQCKGSADGHVVYLYERKNSRLIIPALALIRGIFPPMSRLMPLTFAPGFLDLVSFVNTQEEPARVEISADANCLQDSETRNRLLNRLAWMRSHHSAFQMAGSVHQNAMSGRINLRLPKGHARGAFIGILKGQTLFANSLYLTLMDASDEPRMHNIGIRSKYYFSGSSAGYDSLMQAKPESDGLIKMRLAARTDTEQ